MDNKKSVFSEVKGIADSVVNIMGIYSPQQMTDLLDRYGREIKELQGEINNLKHGLARHKIRSKPTRTFGLDNEGGGEDEDEDEDEIEYELVD